MKLEYFRAHNGNFGDDLNAWLWPRLFPGPPDEDGRRLVGIGSILDTRYSTLPGTKIVFGSGARSPVTAPRLDTSWDVRFVRGPLTAMALGLGPSAAVTDGAAALACLRLPLVNRTPEVGFMPHYRTLAIVDWEKVCEKSAIRFIDPTRPVAEVLGAIGAVDRLITEAMHGAIVADLFRVPWLRVRCHGMHYEGPDVSEFKWSDWGSSLSVDVAAEAFVTLALSPRSLLKRAASYPLHAWRQSTVGRTLRRVADSRRFRLSHPSTLGRAVKRVEAQVQQLESELAASAAT